MPGIYSDKYQLQPANLPWARPLSPLFGGGSTNANNVDRHVLNDEVGWCSVPHAGDIETGSQVFVFFENGNINYPVYFGVAQSGEGWFSEHPNQHCFRTDNVRIRVDENTADQRSTCKFNSYNEHNSEVAKKNLERDCKKNNWKFNSTEGNIEQLETRIDIEVEAINKNAVNLNIHGNVNLHIDGDWFVEHFGNKYEYHEGDLYVKHNGQTYIEEEGHFRKVHRGNYTLEHNGNTVENQEGDTLVTRTGSYWDQIDGDVTHMYNSNYKIKIDGNNDEIVRNDKIVEIGNGFHMNAIENVDMIVGGHVSVNSDTHIDLNMKDNFEINSRTGNIILKTNGEFELMKDGQITAEGFKNLGTRGNIQLISTFGNINIQCIKNDSLANFAVRSTVIPWNPDFVRQVEENIASYGDFSTMDAALKGYNFSTDVSSMKDVLKILEEADKLKIFDGLPVFLPAKMIIQNPNTFAPKNKDDVSWIPVFRDEPSDWRSISDDVMWKLPGRMMGNINIETWSGDINVKTASELGCAGNVNITAEEKLGTFNGYKIGTINFKNKARERIYPDPRDLFLDSNFYRRNGRMLDLFVHGTNKNSDSVLPEICNTFIQQTGYTSIRFANTNYDKFYDTYGMNIVTHGSTVPSSKLLKNKLNALKRKGPISLGCPKCISDYLLGIPGIQEVFYKNENLIDIKGGYHAYGFQRLNPKDTSNARGVFNIETNEFDKISIGDGHAIAHGFMNRDFSSTNIGGITFNGTGNMQINIGKNYYKVVNSLRPNGKLNEHYELIETPYDFNLPNVMKNFIKGLEKPYKERAKKYVSLSKNPTLRSIDEPRTFNADYRTINSIYDGGYIDGGYISEYQRNVGTERKYKEVEDKRILIDYGFDFERARDLLIDNNLVAKIETNLKEYEMFYITSDNGIEKEYHEGGESRWAQIRCYDQYGKMHIELSASFNSHIFKIQDKSGLWLKSHNYHDTGHVWWDDDKFNADLVTWFPDSEFDIISTETDRIWKEMSSIKENHSWSKYGNHIKADKHPKYSMPQSKCDSTHMVFKGGEQMVNTAKKLWEHKKGAGVLVNEDILVTANQTPHIFSLNSADCGKNQNIQTSFVWNAPTEISMIDHRIANKKLTSEKYYSADVNSHTVTHKAAVNYNVMTMDSDHVALIPDSEPRGYVMMGTGTATLSAGNIYKVDLKGNQAYFGFKPGKDEKYLDWKYSNTYENKIGFYSNGFPTNSYGVINGTNTVLSAGSVDKSKIKNSSVSFLNYLNYFKDDPFKEFNNNMIFMNGGYDEKQEINENLTNINEAYRLLDKIPGMDKIVGTNNMPYKITNMYSLVNGKNQGSISSINSINNENGDGCGFAKNGFVFNNGGKDTRKGSNVFRINNEGYPSATLLQNQIVLNNDNNMVTMQMMDEYNVEKSDDEIKPKKMLIKESARSGTIRKETSSIEDHTDNYVMNASTNVTIEAPDCTAKVKNLTIPSGSQLNADFATIYLATDEYAIDTGCGGYTVNSLGQINLNSNDLMTIKSDSKMIIGDSSAIDINGSKVNVKKISANGTFEGHLVGTMIGLPMIFGFIPFPFPLKGPFLPQSPGPVASNEIYQIKPEKEGIAEDYSNFREDALIQSEVKTHGIIEGTDRAIDNMMA